ncbi:MAG TPA: hypothetical protein ENI12_03745 [Nitrospirae bacterium]|nr:hypothetical protein [Nitrospirota bacterium]
MFIRIGIGKFSLSFGSSRKSLDRRDDGNGKPLPEDEKRRTGKDRRGQDPFPEKDSTDTSKE